MQNSETISQEERDRQLLKRLDAGMQCRLALLVAPAGAGKTTLLRRWAAKREWPVAWVSMQPAHNAPQRFLQDVAMALCAVGLDENSVWINGIAPTNLIEGMTDLINAAVEIKEEFALVVDGYQVIDAAVIHDGVAFLLEYLPPRMHLVIATRGEPPLQLGRLRARRMIVELGPQDLARRQSTPGMSP